MHRTNARDEDGATETSWEGGDALSQLLTLSSDELTLIGAFVLSAVFVSVCVVVVCAARCGRYRKQRDKRSAAAGRQPKSEVAAIDSPLMMTSLTSDSLMASDRQVKNQVRSS